MIKVSLFHGETELGPTAVPLFGPADGTFEKCAAPSLLPEVTRYIETLRPRNDAQYVLVNAMGASEYFGSNVNGDAFPEASLIHRPDAWSGNPLRDRILAKTWSYGFPTFYNAHPYVHHRNKDASRAFGEVELAAWHPQMKRVELVVRVDKDKCEQFGGVSIWDKLIQGQFPDVSMGTKVPFDTCSICLDWDAYRKAQASYRPENYSDVGQAILAVHKKKNIRGLSITRKDYCEHALKQMNRILPDGRKVFVYNDYPRFFDISFVFIGADKTAKVMMKLAGDARIWSLPSAELAEKLGYDDSDGQEKTASVPEEQLKTAFLGKRAEEKDGEMTKSIPTRFASKAVERLTQSEKDIPTDILNALGDASPEEALSTSTGLGIVLRPREFQRIMLIQIGRPDMADKYERDGVVFPRVKERENIPMGPEFFSSLIAKLLLPLMGERSGLGPTVEKRILLLGENSKGTKKGTSSLSSDLLHKMGAAYNGYRHELMQLVPSTQEMISASGLPAQGHLYKLAEAAADEVFTPLSVSYFQNAFWDEVGTEKTSAVERGLPSRNTWINNQFKTGGH